MKAFEESRKCNRIRQRDDQHEQPWILEKIIGRRT